METRLEILNEKKLVGNRLNMSFSANKTYELWRGFMTGRNRIRNNIGTELYSIEVYEPMYFENFNPGKEFEKWAAIEVTDFNSVPDGFETIALPGGLYAVFIHRGPASEGPRTYGYIFNEWLPKSAYILDDRPHFALMGEKYKNDSQDSEEEIWIPVKPKFH
jgi:AraC family transcriptional regulator